MNQDNQLPYVVNCEVKLLNPDGSFVPNGFYDITFSLCESLSAEEVCWTEKHSSVLL